MVMKRNFTLIELVLVIAIVVILAAAMVPIVREAREGARVSEILRLSDTLKLACQQYYTDTGTYAVESSPAPPSNPLVHGLAGDDGKAGWNGPYINNFISSDDNPYNLAIVVGRVKAPIEFDLDGNGTVDRTVGNFLQISGVPDSAVKKINDQFDSHLGDSNWENTGRVEYMGSNIVNIYLIGR